MMLIESNLWRLLGAFIFCHNMLLVILLLLSFIKIKKFKEESKNWIYTLNTLLPVFSLLYFLSLGIPLFEAWYGQNPYEWYVFTESTGNYNIYVFYIRVLLPFLIGMLFFWKKLRLNYFIIIIYLVAAHFEFIKRLLLKLTREYIPSSWKTHDDSIFLDIVLQWIFPVLLISLTYFFLHKKNKLPFSSAFLR